MSIGELLYLSRADIDGLDLDIEDVYPLVRSVYAEKGLGKVESPPKRGVIPSPGCSIRGMMAHVPSLAASGVKWISAFPPNVGSGLPTITGLVILNDSSNGLPRAIMDCTWITAMRTAAATALAAEHMARPESSTVGIVACGLQGRVNLEALAPRFPLRIVKVYDKDPQAMTAYAELMTSKLGLDVRPVSSAREAAADVDILITSLPIVRRPAPPIEDGVLKPGAFCALLDYNAALTVAALRQADKIIVDDAAQLRFFRSIGYFRGTPEPDGDLGKVVAGRQRGRDTDDQRIIALNLGIGVLDIATASLILERALDRGVGAALPL